jgi:transcriptional regulator with XRE-family HTH domain
VDESASDNGEITDEEARDAVLRLGALVREHRQRSSMTLAEVAERAQLSLGLLSRLENGIGNPSLSTLTKLAEAIGVHVAALFDAPAESYRAWVRPDERMELTVPSAGVRHRMLQPQLNPRFIVSVLELSPAEDATPHQHAGTEFVSVLSGRVVLTVEDERYVLRKGDSATYDSGRPHLLRPDGRTSASLLYTTSPGRLP